MNGRNAAQRFEEILRHARESESAIAVYANDSDLNDYEVGFVEDVGTRSLVLLALTPKGEPDGRQVILVEDIHRIDAETAYTKKLSLLYSYRTSVFETDFHKLPKDTGRDVPSLLEVAREQNICVNLVDQYGYGPSGFIRQVGTDHVELERLNSKGHPDGIAVIMLDAIDRVHLGRREEQVLAFLHRYNVGLKRLLDA
jgi:hypothetical protein